MSVKSKTPCRYGTMCKMAGNKVCPYLHPSSHTFCRHGPNCCLRGKGCTYVHSIPCRYRNRCLNHNCIYVHTCSAIKFAGNPCGGIVYLGCGTWRCLNHQMAGLPR